MLEKLPNTDKIELLKFLNLSWNRQKLPEQWKISIIKPIKKPEKNPEEINSYRPIALTSCICKIMEKMIGDRLRWFLEKNELLNYFQSGFRKNHNTIDHVIRLYTEAQNSVNCGNYTVALFLDFSKAFEMLWTDGAVLKLTNLGLTGNIIKWIKDFLENRKIIVKITNESSKEYKTKNGTPQGSCLSPLIFLIMINDFPTLSKFTQKALFADDSSIWRSGTNLPHIIHHLQEDLLLIETWCAKWGFHLNSNKTIGIIFTNCKKYVIPNLFIGKEKVKFEQTAIFLGVKFDSRLTWGSHVAQIEEKSKTKLNLMRCISGIKWGASTQNLLLVYRALIRPLFDYGSIVFGNAAKVHLKKLETIQYKALQIAMGTLKGTAAASLQVSCKEYPLDIRRNEMKQKYLIKISSLDKHNVKELLTEMSLPSLNKKFQSGLSCCLVNFQDMLESHFISKAEINYQTSPFTNVLCNFSILGNKNLKNDKNEYDPQKIQKFINESNKNKIKVYTDCSYLNKNKVSVAVCVPEQNITEIFKIEEAQTVTAGELAAIHEAIKLSITHKYKQTLILTDSQQALTFIQNKSNKTLSNLVNMIHKTITETKHTHSVELCWIPSHCGVKGNETADRAAKTGHHLILKSLKLPFELEEIYTKMKNDSHSTWQERWTASKTGCKYREICPEIKEIKELSLKPRRKEVMINRLKLQSCGLNFYLHKIGIKPTPLCETCQVNETVEHFLLSCKNNQKMIKELLSEFIKLRPKMSLSVKTALSEPTLINIIYKHSISNERFI